MRELNKFEVANVAFLTRYGLDFGLLEPTPTGLAKSIMDATLEYRSFLLRIGLHDYAAQAQGALHKRCLPAKLMRADGEVAEANASLYRPSTKKGDPRIWFSRLNRYCSPGDVLVTIWQDNCLWVLNASKVNFTTAIASSPSYKSVFKEAVEGRESVFEELLDALRAISSRGFIPTLRNGDTGVGHLLETELGIKANSSKAPDYKGVEIKSTRGTRLRSLTLFAKVPDWTLSQIGSFDEFCANFGYDKLDGKGRRLNCTVSAKVWNSQRLRLEVDEKGGLLHEISESSTYPRPLSWELAVLRETLAQKHADTFWVKAESRTEGPIESIRYVSVVQTSRPIIQQLSPMIATGGVTVDHLINLKDGNPNLKPREAGPLFKVSQRRFSELFPAPIIHNLLPDGGPS